MKKKKLTVIKNFSLSMKYFFFSFFWKQTELTPIENATEMILSKNKELDKIVNDFSTTKKSNINPLSMILNGVIDANVNGGIANYQSVCFLYVLFFTLDVKFLIRRMQQIWSLTIYDLKWYNIIVIDLFVIMGFK